MDWMVVDDLLGFAFLHVEFLYLALGRGVGFLFNNGTDVPAEVNIQF
jgi:hypothetical protein